MWRTFHHARLALLLTTGLLALEISARESRGQAIETSYYLLQASVVDATTCAPSANAEIVWIGHRNAEKVLVTDSNGQLLSFLEYGWGWVSWLYARQGNRVSQMHSVLGASSLTPELALGPPASLSGTIRKLNGAPLSDCVVRLAVPSKQPEIFLETLTDKAGDYQFDSVPPGVYFVLLEHETHFSPFLSRFDYPSNVSLLPGEATRFDVTMEKRALIAGKVLAPDGSGAPGVVFTANCDNRFQPDTMIRTDDDGEFEARIVPFASTNVDVGVESTDYGAGLLKIPTLGPGDSQKGLVVQLGGVVRVRGTVRDPAGTPLSGIYVDAVTTDATGGYSTGPLALPRSGPLKLRFNPPSPRNDDDWLSFGANSTTWYRRTELEITASHGEELVRDVVLEPMVWRELHGRVLKQRGKPAKDVEVLVYCGAPQARQWLGDRTLAAPRWREPYPPIPYSSGVGFEPATLLARCHTDEDGRWKAWVLPEASDRGGWMDPGDMTPDPDAFAVVAHHAEQGLVAVQYFNADGSFETPGDVELTLAPMPEDLVTRLYVVDEQGRPLSGIRWLESNSRDVLFSDTKGSIGVARTSGISFLNVQDSAYAINNVRLEGEFARPSQPASDPPSNSNRYFMENFELGLRPGTSGDKHIQWKRSQLYFVPFDDEKARLVVTLSRNASEPSGSE